MSYNEVYLLVLGAIALISSGVILFTANKTSQYRLKLRKRKKQHYGES